MPGALTESIFRTHAACELVLADRLSAAERRALGRRLDDPSVFGLLKRGGAAAAKVVDRDAALLLFTLHEPGPLPRFLRREMGDEALRRWVRGLLAAGILELRLDGGFVTGERALRELESAGGSPRRRSRISELSRAALAAVASLPRASAGERARWLYRYNRLPAGRERRGKLGGEAEIRHLLGLDGAPGRRLDRIGPRGGDEAWVFWSGTSEPIPAGGPIFKLYVSPHADDLPAALARVAERIDELEVCHLKLGRTLRGLLRPDKLMLYFADLEALGSAAEALRRPLAGLRPQAVPFTSEIALDGLLSWGADPPPGTGSRNGRRSWRQWITGRLAAAFDELPASGTDGPAWRGVLDLLALEGVDTESWAPDRVRWLGLEPGS